MKPASELQSSFSLYGAVGMPGKNGRLSNAHFFISHPPHPRTVSNIAPVNNLNSIVHMNGGTCGGATLTRPRPQPIAGTPPPDPNEKCDAKVIQQTCNLFGLDLERPPPVPPSRPYTVTGNKKFGYPQIRTMKKPFPEETGNGSHPTLLKGDTVVVVGASDKRGHLVVEHSNHNLIHVPFQFLELKPGPMTIQ